MDDDIWYMDVHFYCPLRDFERKLYQLRELAEKNGLGYEVLWTRQFRNPQRFGARAKQAVVRLASFDPDLLVRVTRHIPRR